MALPVVNSQNSVDASTIQQTVLNAAAKTGKLQINNSGSINFTNYVQGGTQTATKESTNFISEAGNRVLGEIRNLLVSLNNNIGKFIQTANIEKSVAANLAEAAAPKDVDETSRYRLVDLRDDFKTIINGLGEKLSYDKEGRQRGDSGIGGFKGFSGNLLLGLATVFRSLAKAVPLLAGAYVINMLTGGKLEKYISKLSDTVLKEISGVFGGETGTGTGGQVHSEPGELGDTGTGGTRTTPSTTQQPNVNQPQVNQQQTGPQKQPSTRDVPFNPQTATPSKRIFGSNTNVATDSDLAGLTFTYRKNNPDKNIVKGLAQRLQYIRRKLGGKNLYINSGYRTYAHNKEVGGAKNSLHMRGWAADVRMSDLTMPERKKFLIAASECGIGGIGFYSTFIHIDLGNKRKWTSIPDWAKEIMNNHYAGKYRMGDELLPEDNKSDLHKESNEAGNNEGQQPNITPDKKDTSSNVSTPKSTASRVMESVGNAIGSVLGISDANATQDITKNNPTEGLQTAEKVTISQKTEKIKTNKNKGRFSQQQIDMANLIRKKFKAAGFSAMHAEAAVLNAMQESTLNPNAHNTSKEDSVGLFQLNRDAGLGKDPITKKKYPVEFLKNPSNNIDIVIREAKKYKQFRNAKTLKEAVRAFVHYVERPGADHEKETGWRYAFYEKGTYPGPDEEAENKIVVQNPNIETKKTPEQPQPNTADTTTPETQQPNTADTTTPEQQPESELDQLKSMLPGAEKLALFGDEEKLLPLLMNTSNKDINNVVSELMSSVKNVGDKLRASVKESQGDIDTNTFKTIIEQNDPRKNLIPETASVAPTPEANKGEQLNEEAKNLETARTKALYESNKKDLSPVMTPNPPQVTQKRSDNPPVNSTMGVNKMALRNDDEPTLFRLLVKALDIGNVA